MNNTTLNIYENLEKSVNKKNVSYIKKLFENLGYDIDYQKFKGIIYGNTEPSTKTEKEYKNVYDTYIYLLINRKIQIDLHFNRRWYYLLFEKEIPEDLSQKLINEIYEIDELTNLEKVARIHLKIYEIFEGEDKKNQKIIAFLMLNYLLYRYDYPMIKLLYKDFTEYDEVIKTKDEQKLTIFLIKLLQKQKIQDKSYYKNLKPLSLEEVYEGIKEEKETLKELFRVKSVAITGSFSKGDMRIDSDIDLLISYQDPICYIEKIKCYNGLKEYLENKFKRFVDLIETSNEILEEMIEIYDKAIKIY